MLKSRRLTYSNVIATLALFVALGGTGYAATQLTGDDIKNNSLSSEDIKNKSLTGGDVKDKSLAGTDVKDGTIAGRDIATNAVTGSHVAPETLSGTNIAPDALTGADIAEGGLGPVPNADKVDGQDASDFVPQEKLRADVARLNPGETKQLVTIGSLVFTATCTEGGPAGATHTVHILRNGEDVFQAAGHPGQKLHNSALTLFDGDRLVQMVVAGATGFGGETAVFGDTQCIATATAIVQ
jgi:hypothetical protein